MRDSLKATLQKLLILEITDSNFIIALNSACAYLFAHPETVKITEAEKSLLKAGYLKLEEPRG